VLEVRPISPIKTWKKLYYLERLAGELGKGLDDSTLPLARAKGGVDAYDCALPRNFLGARNMDGFLEELARYDAWANAELLRAVESLRAGDERVRSLLAHLTAGKLMWIGRVRGGEVPAGLWPEWTVEESARRLRLIDREFVNLAGREEPQRMVQYENTQGAPYEMAAWDLMVHVVNHGTYHRGQLASALKNAGGVPAVTDYIAWARYGKPGVGLTR
jgi:uncharacterized damage-inducible protein DinB